MTDQTQPAPQDQVPPLSAADQARSPSEGRSGSAGYFEDVAAQQLARKLLDAKPAQSTKFHLVVIPDGGDPYVATFDVIDELITKMQSLEKQYVYTYAFMGHFMPISKPPHRYLMTPLGALPLFVPPSSASLEIDPTGWLGDPEHSSVLSDALAEHEAQWITDAELQQGVVTSSPVVNNDPPDDLLVQ